MNLFQPHRVLFLNKFQKINPPKSIKGGYQHFPNIV